MLGANTLRRNGAKSSQLLIALSTINNAASFPHFTHSANLWPTRSTPPQQQSAARIWCGTVMANGAVWSPFVILALFVSQPLPQSWGAMLRNATGDAPPLEQHKGRAGE
ncbi:hypothetical protein [Grimontia marina]|uniref:hypothetical protein n=1 Tax=Grimontia marina TaxID=646534 RepID=UPI0012F889C1|nr:hypothetical protein [Grimontia marina]